MRPCEKCGSTGLVYVLKEEPMIGPYCDECWNKLSQAEIERKLGVIKGIKKLYPTTWQLPADDARVLHERGIF